MNFNGSGGLMLLIIAGLWVGVFVPSWFRRSQLRQVERKSSQSLRGEIKNIRQPIIPGSRISLAQQSFRLQLTQTISSSVAVFAFLGAIWTIFAAVSQIFYIFFSGGFLAIFIVSVALSRAAKRKNRGILTRAAKNRAGMFSSAANSSMTAEFIGDTAENPVNKRAWEPNALPAPRQRIGELTMQSLAEVVEIENRVAKNATAELDSTALDEILRRRRANG
ncbi:MAG: hypothetical protein F2544_04210 [Actinobacteria bacterium]|uniref:Unannotated protein n=2 Tax=freshwater metagenome TaxID=449393 RepID=A0A6J6IT65_9ZZZZ|nr:hypothetical protein [Actinomycetota bacterium]MTA92571.1 hypothetical protein [Actinomycetota bacterium]